MVPGNPLACLSFATPAAARKCLRPFYSHQPSAVLNPMTRIGFFILAVETRGTIEGVQFDLSITNSTQQNGAFKRASATSFRCSASDPLEIGGMRVVSRNANCRSA
jgi:hypothetical protein